MFTEQTMLEILDEVAAKTDRNSEIVIDKSTPERKASFDRLKSLDCICEAPYGEGPYHLGIFDLSEIGYAIRLQLRKSRRNRLYARWILVLAVLTLLVTAAGIGVAVYLGLRQ